MPDPRLVRPIPPSKARDWVVTLDGLPITSVAALSLTHPRIGSLQYGLTPHGYDGWVFRELRGGVGLLAYVVREGELLVLVVEQDRPNQGGMVLNIPRGFVDLGESPRAAARRELHEETGLALDEARLMQLPGAVGNPNSAFFDTSDPDSGVVFFGVELYPNELPEGNWSQSDAQEGLRGARLIPWYEAAGLGDLVSNAGIARLLATRRR